MNENAWIEKIVPMRKGLGPARQLKRVSKILKVEINRIAELGVYKGRNAEKLRILFPEAELHLIDAWARLRKRGPMMKANPTPEHWETIYQELLVRFGNMDGPTHFHRMLTAEAAEKFEDQSFDLIYIDGDHSYKGVMKDLKAWFPKVRAGGLIAGHDFRRSKAQRGVVRAVREFFGPGRFAVLWQGVWVKRK